MTHAEEFRQQLIDSLRRELVGPAWNTSNPDSAKDAEDAGPDDVLQESPVQRYSAGVLFPTNQPIVEIEDADILDEGFEADESEPAIYAEEQFPDSDTSGRGDDAISDAYDETVRLANEFRPAAIGLTFITKDSGAGLLIQARAAEYKSQKPADSNSKLREWRRTALDIKPVTLEIPPDTDHGIKSFELAKCLRMRAIYHRRQDGSFLVTISLVNTRQSSDDAFPSGTDCYFQTEVSVTATDNSFVFNEYRTSNRSLKDLEEASLELLYRNRNLLE